MGVVKTSSGRKEVAVGGGQDQAGLIGESRRLLRVVLHLRSLRASQLPCDGPHGRSVGVPTLLNEAGLRFFFYSNEGDPREAPHVHVECGDGVAKFWLSPVRLADSIGMVSKDLKRAREIVEKNATSFKERWDAYFNA